MGKVIKLLPEKIEKVKPNKDVKVIKLEQPLTLLEMLKKSANVTVEEESFEDYIDKAKELMDEADRAYYGVTLKDYDAKIDYPKLLEDKINEAMKVLSVAKVFAKNFGFES